jgi:mannose-6-phosphate isomerase-like protein (cupin superfamily)
MIPIAVLDLNKPDAWNRWIVGTPEDVPASSPFFSEQIQIAFVNNPEKSEFRKRETEHSHAPPIEEYYLVLKGTLKIKVENKTITLRPMQILKVPPLKRHKIIHYSLPVRWIIIRAPISTPQTKMALT